MHPATRMRKPDDESIRLDGHGDITLESQLRIYRQNTSSSPHVRIGKHSPRYMHGAAGGKGGSRRWLADHRGGRGVVESNTKRGLGRSTRADHEPQAMGPFSNFPRSQLHSSTGSRKAAFAFATRHTERRSAALTAPTNRDDGKSVLIKNIVSAAITVHHVSWRNRLKTSRAVVPTNRDAPTSGCGSGAFQCVYVTSGRQHHDRAAFPRPASRASAASKHDKATSCALWAEVESNCNR